PTRRSSDLEENAIQLVVGKTREHTAALDVGRGKLRISDQDARSFRSTPQAETNLPPIGKLAPEIDASIRRADSILCHSIAVLQTEDTTLFEIELRRKEVSTGERQWLVELGEEARILPDLQIGEPLTAQTVQLRHDEANRGVVAAVALEIVLEIEPYAHVVRPPALASQGELESVASLLLDEGVVDRFEAIERVQGRQLPRNYVFIEGASNEILHRRLHESIILAGALVSANELDRSGLHRARLACGHVRLPLLLADGKLGESLARLTCTLLARTDRARHAREVSRSESAERRVDENICARQLGPLLERAAADENRKSLVGHFERRLELLTRIQGEAHIDDDENIHSHGARGRSEEH